MKIHELLNPLELSETPVDYDLQNLMSMPPENVPTIDDIKEFCNKLSQQDSEKSLFKFLQKKYTDLTAPFRTKGLNVIGLNFTNADFRECDVSHTQFRNCIFLKTNLVGVRAEGADFSTSSIILANFSKAHLVNAKFSGTSFQGNNLEGANTQGIQLTGAVRYLDELNSMQTVINEPTPSTTTWQEPLVPYENSQQNIQEVRTQPEKTPHVRLKRNRDTEKENQNEGNQNPFSHNHLDRSERVRNAKVRLKKTKKTSETQPLMDKENNEKDVQEMRQLKNTPHVRLKRKDNRENQSHLGRVYDRLKNYPNNTIENIINSINNWSEKNYEEREGNKRSKTDNLGRSGGR